MRLDKAEIKRISDFLNDVHEGLCEGDEGAMLWPHFWQL